MEPSPTAEATRFTAPWRTSPAAKTPGMLVSSGKGKRSTCHPRRGGAVLREVPAGDDVSVLVTRYLLGQPVGVRFRTDEHEQPGRGDGLGEARGGILEDEVLQPSPAAAVHHPRPRARTQSNTPARPTCN
jgi:hypothetical protein